MASVRHCPSFPVGCTMFYPNARVAIKLTVGEVPPTYRVPLAMSTPPAAASPSARPARPRPPRSHPRPPPRPAAPRTAGRRSPLTMARRSPAITTSMPSGPRRSSATRTPPGKGGSRTRRRPPAPDVAPHDQCRYPVGPTVSSAGSRIQPHAAHMPGVCDAGGNVYPPSVAREM